MKPSNCKRRRGRRRREEERERKKRGRAAKVKERCQLWTVEPDSRQLHLTDREMNRACDWLKPQPTNCSDRRVMVPVCCSHTLRLRQIHSDTFGSGLFSRTQV